MLNKILSFWKGGEMEEEIEIELVVPKDEFNRVVGIGSDIRGLEREKPQSIYEIMTSYGLSVASNLGFWRKKEEDRDFIARDSIRCVYEKGDDRKIVFEEISVEDILNIFEEILRKSLPSQVQRLTSYITHEAYSKIQFISDNLYSNVSRKEALPYTCRGMALFASRLLKPVSNTVGKFSLQEISIFYCRKLPGAEEWEWVYTAW